MIGSGILKNLFNCFLQALYAFEHMKWSSIIRSMDSCSKQGQIQPVMLGGGEFH